jgi:hypothetical protein
MNRSFFGNYSENQGLIPDTSNEHIKEACVAASNMD